MRADQDTTGAMFLRVYLDDVLQGLCEEADEEKGFVRVVERDESGRVKIGRGAIAVRVVKHGKVEIRLRDTAPPWVREMYPGLPVESGV